MESVFKTVKELLLIYPPFYDAVITLAILVITFALAKIAVSFSAWISARLTTRITSKLDEYILEAIRKPLQWIILITGFHVALHRLRHRKYVLLEDYWNWIEGLLFVFGAGIVILACIRVMMAVLRWYGRRVDEQNVMHIKGEFVPLIDKLGKILLFMLGIVVVLDHFGIDINTLLVTLGVGGLAVGLALQDTLANIFAGITIMVDRPFRLNDRIQIPSGEIGDVVNIGMRSTRIRTPENTVLVIPNKTLVNDNVVNQSYPDRHIRIELAVSVAYGSNLERAKKLMEDAARDNPLVVEVPPPVVFFATFGESSLNLLMHCWLRDFTQVLAVTDQINAAIHRSFAEAGIELPFPHRVVYLRQESRQPS